MNLYDIFEAGGTGVIASKSQANDPRYSMSLTKDVRPGQIQKSLKAFNLAEDNQPDYNTVGNKFVQHCAKALGLKKLPKIRLVKEIGQSEHPTFGTFDPNTNTIRVAYQDRHIMDVLRTLGHELVHHKQREENRIKPGDGETGSDIENEANAQAGVLMRDFADQNANLFKTDADLTEHSDWPVRNITQQELIRLILAATASRDIAAEKGFDITFKDHFFNQLKLDRGMPITPDMIYHTIGRLIGRKFNMFNSLKDGEPLAIHDSRNNIILGMSKEGENKFNIATIVCDTKWLGSSHKVEI